MRRDRSRSGRFCRECVALTGHDLSIGPQANTPGREGRIMYYRRRAELGLDLFR